MEREYQNEKNEMKIVKVQGREILDSRGYPTVEAEVFLQGGAVGRASVPSGACHSAFEAAELRDDKERYMGKGVRSAVKSIEQIIAPGVAGMDATRQRQVDEWMIEEDSTADRSHLGANAILAVSLAVAKAAAAGTGMPLFRYLGGCSVSQMPVPLMNMIHGGCHADSSLDIQDFMIIPCGFLHFHERLEAGTKVYHTLKNILKADGLATSVGDEGGFAVCLEENEQALQYLVRAIREAGYEPGKQFKLAIDAAAGRMYAKAVEEGMKGKYLFWKSGHYKTSEQMLEYFERLCDEYPVGLIEDALAEEDWTNWERLTRRLGDRILLAGDSLFAAKRERIQKGIQKRAANAVLIKLNQAGTLTEAMDAARLAMEHGWKVIISHRSGETEDTTIADLSVAMQTGMVKLGAPSRTERTAKYNQLLRIEEQMLKNQI